MHKISLLGCGWLGLPLAKALLEKGHTVKGSTTSENKLTVLRDHGISPLMISVSETGIDGDIASFLKESEILIIDIPPKLRGTEQQSFVGKMQSLIPHIESSGVANVILISSTSVYSDDNSSVTENTVAFPDTESGKQLLQTEAMLLGNINFKTTVVRFGGLIGDDRHPVRSLAGRQNIENPAAPINLIHQDDCIGIILKIIEKNEWNQVFNAATPYHPNRETYYTKKAIAIGLPPPLFNHDKESAGKTILSDKVQHVLDYKFTVIENI